MEQEQSWPRGRHSSWSNDGRDGGGGHSPRRMHHSGSPSHKFKPNKPVWDDTVHDLALMRLTPAELARKLASRQSTNMMLARAQLLDQSRRSGPQSLSLPPTLAARLQAARQQSVDSILAQSNSTLVASQKVRQTEPNVRLEEEEAELESGTAQEESVLEDENQKSQFNPDHEERGCLTMNDSNFTSGVKPDDEIDKGKTFDPPEKEACKPEKIKAMPQTDASRNVAEQRQTELRSARDTARPVDRSQIAATRTSLDHTITMVVNTCRELWLQLEEERLTREHLQQQLQQQGNVITTLTAELLQIQEQQEAILREVSDARASGLWGAGEVDLGDGRGDMLASHMTPGKHHGLRPSPQQTSSRHPQRSILRATRTIHQPHQRQSPQSFGRTHQTNHSSLPMSHRPPHSPRPHQPSSRSHTHSLQMHRPSPPPDPPLSPRPESASIASYKASVSRQIRDALGNEKPVPGARERNSSTSSQGYCTMSEEALQRDIREQESQDNVGTASEDNLGSDLPVDPSLPEHRERKKQ